MGTKEHRSDKKYPDLHSNENPGACLNRHLGYYSDTTYCSHRWQAYVKAKECSQWYNYPAYQDLQKTVVKKTFTTSLWGRTVTFNRPNPGDWDLKVNGNFQEKARIPYWHNAHHIIPDSVLNNCIRDAAKTSGRLYKLVRTSLLKAKYNLNHKKNMVLLPMEKEIAAALGLPRHIAGIEGNMALGPGPWKFEVFLRIIYHHVYSTKVTNKVEKVIRKYAKSIKLEDHDENVPDFSKNQLENISLTIFQKLRAWQKMAKTGAPMDDISI